ncbi:hypothetical protein [Cucumibacter marinus]|uniref:hypothetical protein n=1 Tax=Cucumibacter marinus TaxID=1121252 RepID=UPI0004094FA5|nr:hypothetical protein [Cucumibacter marinus]
MIIELVTLGAGIVLAPLLLFVFAKGLCSHRRRGFFIGLGLGLGVIACLAGAGLVLSLMLAADNEAACLGQGFAFNCDDAYLITTLPLTAAIMAGLLFTGGAMALRYFKVHQHAESHHR